MERKNKINNVNYYNRVPGVAGGGRTKFVPAISVDTLRGGRKGDPQHECCEKTIYLF